MGPRLERGELRGGGVTVQLLGPTVRLHGRATFKKCSEVASRFGIADESARACDARLAAHSKP